MQNTAHIALQCKVNSILLSLVFSVPLLHAQQAVPKPQSCNLPPKTNALKKMQPNPNKADVNVLGTPLQIAGTSPLTGYYRNGYCSTGPTDAGVHVVAAIVTDAFLKYSLSQGNDLITPRGSFPGLKPGNKWCLCAARWKEAFLVGVAPPVILEATHQKALEFVTLEQLQSANK